jgi:hypothetical protein
MKLRMLLLVPMLALGLSFSLAGCGAGDLTEDHPGWKNALCFDCHGKTTGYPHGADRREPGCRDCHGGNGAPLEAHAGERQSCSTGGCHGSTGHIAVFSAPADCAGCHAP